MAAGDLTFQGAIICNASGGDIHSRIANEIPQLDTADIMFANTAGREIRITGLQHTGNSCFAVEYGNSSGVNSCIFKSTATAMATFLYGTIQTLLTSSTQIGSLVDKYGTYSGMRMVSFNVTSPVRPTDRGGTNQVYITFSARFERYTV